MVFSVSRAPITSSRQYVWPVSHAWKPFGQAAKYISNQMEHSETFYKERHSKIREWNSWSVRGRRKNTIRNGSAAGYLGMNMATKFYEFYDYFFRCPKRRSFIRRCYSDDLEYRLLPKYIDELIEKKSTTSRKSTQTKQFLNYDFYYLWWFLRKPIHMFRK